jgi:hypothetical protein
MGGILAIAAKRNIAVVEDTMRGLFANYMPSEHGKLYSNIQKIEDPFAIVVNFGKRALPEPVGKQLQIYMLLKMHARLLLYSS